MATTTQSTTQKDIADRIFEKVQASINNSKTIKIKDGRVELTKEQEDKINNVYIPKWRAIATNTNPTNFEEAKRGATLCYRALGLKEPTEFYLVNNPREAIEKAQEIVARYMPGTKLTNEELFHTQSYAFSDASWLVFYDFFKRETDIDVSDTEGLMVLAENCGWWIGTVGETEDEPSICIFEHRPSVINVNFPQNVTQHSFLHSETGPALAFRIKEGDKPIELYRINDVEVTKKVVDRTYTAQDIDNEPNAEVKRIMVERFGNDEMSGPARYIKESNMTPIATDEWGSIYRKDQGEDEPIWVVKLINSTMEPDGTFKEYWETFDPTCYGGLAAKIPHAAVASRFRRRDLSLYFEKYTDYHPIAES